ncbi:flagellar hook-associated protein 2 [Terribacillus sp. 7520-G]|uniref:flagellar hook-associated protein 2 n=1 Tax=Terribacillus TaxID=459532 RepID=UPI000BA69A86|nr:flagellar hook-associated protein 2 [Terribacillus sp. 7520-G]PAD38553.1 hypothetical protein CHH53_10710 [Terribacillus sp. 7520-G]
MVDSVSSSSSSNSMRVGGLASGIDTDSLVEQLMNAERQKLYKLQQQQTTLTWQQDAYREVNTSLNSFYEKVKDMRLSTNFNTKSTSSTSSALTVTAGSAAPDGNFTINVKQIAKASINTSGSSIAEAGFDPDAAIGEQTFAGGKKVTEADLSFSITTYDQDGNEQVHDFSYETTDSLNDILSDITNSDAGVRAFYDEQTRKVVIEKKDTGQFNKDGGSEISFDASTNNFFTSFLNLDENEESKGQNAVLVYNDKLEITTTENSYNLNGMTLNFTAPTNGAATVTVSNDVDAAVEKITAFVDEYNKLIEEVNGKLTEQKYRDYPPLTEAQKEEMSEDEIKLWEEKAKSGLLRSDSTLTSGLSGLRSTWYSSVENGGTFTHLTQIGITTSKEWRDNGKLVIDETKLREALTEDPDAVHKLFYNNTEDESRGLLNRLEDSLKKTMDNIYNKAGKSTYTNDQFTIGKSLNEVNERIESYQDYLKDVEDRYWRQFSAMEQAISQLNQQSAYLMSNFGTA